MPIHRGWAAQIEDAHSPLAQYQRAVAAKRAAAAAPEPIDLAAFVTATLDGAIGDASVATQDEAIATVEAGLAAHAGRPLDRGEKFQIMIAVVTEWNARELAQEAEDRRGRGEWLADYRDGAR